ncbi:hypothetical protein FQA39_LY17006 [Lamprigera yunnana]|nr:hypothetical protein FQA39_LY17006 [Lamprigera yunnana]
MYMHFSMDLDNTILNKIITRTVLNQYEYKIYNVLYTGFVPNDAEIDLIFYNSCSISRKEVDTVISKKLMGERNVLKVFQAFNTDCKYNVFVTFLKLFLVKGFIDLNDLKKAHKHISPNLSWDILCHSFIQITNNGMLNFEFFQRIYLV